MSQQLAFTSSLRLTRCTNRARVEFLQLIDHPHQLGIGKCAQAMFTPSSELVTKYSGGHCLPANDPQDRRVQELIYDYIIRTTWRPDPKTGRRRRLMMLLFRGDDAVRKTRSVIGNISADRRGGETIRDTYGDLIIDEKDQVKYFEPYCGAGGAECRGSRDQGEVVGALFRRGRRHRGRHARLCAGREAAAHACLDQAG